jgi:adenylate kinase
MITYSDVMLEEASRRGWANARDDIRKLDPSEQRDLQKTAARSISEKATTGLVVDTHATVRTQRGYLPGLPTWVLDELRPELIIVVESAPSEIIRRRNADKSRQRDAQDATAVQQHQDVNKAICMAYAAYTGATVKILQNPDGRLDEAVAELVLTLQGL